MISEKLLGDKARKARELKGYSRKYVADKLGASIMTVYRREMGDRAIPLSDALRLAKIYEMPFECIFLDKAITNEIYK